MKGKSIKQMETTPFKRNTNRPTKRHSSWKHIRLAIPGPKLITLIDTTKRRHKIDRIITQHHTRIKYKYIPHIMSKKRNLLNVNYNYAKVTHKSDFSRDITALDKTNKTTYLTLRVQYQQYTVYKNRKNK